jgi:virginiamycin A acetyltransferase
MRELLKTLIRGVAFVVILPVLLSYAVRRVALGADRALEGSSQALALIPGLPGQYLRRAFLACVIDAC